MGQLPEQVQANLATLQRLQGEQQSVADGLRKAQDAMMLLENRRRRRPPRPRRGPAPPTRSSRCARRSRSCARATPTSTPT